MKTKTTAAKSPASSQTRSSAVSSKASRKRVPFRIRKGGAQTVAVVGTFTEWEKRPIPLIESEPGIWLGEVELPEGRHEYLFLADGREWMPDAAALESVPNPWGGINSIIEVRV